VLISMENLFLFPGHVFCSSFFLCTGSGSSLFGYVNSVRRLYLNRSLVSCSCRCEVLGGEIEFDFASSSLPRGRLVMCLIPGLICASWFVSLLFHICRLKATAKGSPKELVAAKESAIVSQSIARV
jgi:hypothetical protein